MTFNHSPYHNLSQMLLQFKTHVQRHWSMKNNNTIRMAGRRPFIAKSSALIKDRDLLINQLSAAWPHSPITYPIQACFKFYFTNFYTKQNKMNLKLGDLDNLLALPSDALQKAGIIENDALILSFDGSRKLPSKGPHNVLEITLTRYDDPV